MTPQQANLAPCPFCGGSATPQRSFGRGAIAATVWCDSCHVGTPWIHGDGCEDRAIAAWNRRAPAPTEPAVDRDAVIAEVRAEVSEMRNHLEAFGEYSQETARCILDGVVDTIDDMLATPSIASSAGHSKFGSPELQEMIISHATTQVAQASQPTSAEELQQKEHIPPFAEPASQLDPTMSVLTEARVLDLFDDEFALQDLEVTDEEIMLFALSIETEVLKQLSASRCRAQGGITNDSKGLPTSAEGKDSDELDPACGCRTCNPAMVGQWFFMCAICGNKRCPHANDHRNDCTGSNEAGQPGSAYA